MADIVSPEVRSRMMAGIGPTDTKPELIIRSGLHALGYRFRLGRSYRERGKLLPGRPDLVFPGRRAVILINGCFWHGHDCALFRWPATRSEFWRGKIMGNIARDARVHSELGERGWRVLEVWECTLKGKERRPVDEVVGAADAFLRGQAPALSIGTDRRVAAAGPATAGGPAAGE